MFIISARKWMNFCTENYCEDIIINETSYIFWALQPYLQTTYVLWALLASVWISNCFRCIFPPNFVDKKLPSSQFSHPLIFVISLLNAAFDVLAKKWLLCCSIRDLQIPYVVSNERKKKIKRRSWVKKTWSVALH